VWGVEVAAVCAEENEAFRVSICIFVSKLARVRWSTSYQRPSAKPAFYVSVCTLVQVKQVNCRTQAQGSKMCNRGATEVQQRCN
jgi:hypothetical protein